MTWHIARSLGIPQSEIGIAGIKDRRAVTRQYVWVPARCGYLVSRIDDERMRVLHAQRHRKKLARTSARQSLLDSRAGRRPRTNGTCRGGRRDRVHGFPNYFGSQRFGVDDSTLSLGYDLLRGTQRPRDLPSHAPVSARPGVVSRTVGSFHLALAQRIHDDLLRTVLAGDVMLVAASGGRFVVEDVDREQTRFMAGETTLSGLLFGPDMLEPRGEPAEREMRVLQARELEPAAFQQFAKLTSGTCLRLAHSARGTSGDGRTGRACVSAAHSPVESTRPRC